jgi:pectate lyase
MLNGRRQNRFAAMGELIGILAVLMVGFGDSPARAAGSPGQAARAIPAFPGAEGFGAYAIGGRGGRVLEVTNLNDSGPGSLRAAVEASGARIVVFRVSGTIELLSRIRIENPFVTIAGQTAPGGGITLKNHPSNIRSTLEIRTHDVVVRHIRSRPGPSAEPSDTVDALTISAGHNIIVDHCSLSWATDEVVNTWNDVHDITIQWSIISEGLHKSTHPKGKHSKGMLLGSNGAQRISVHHNLFAHNYDRNPDVNLVGVVDVVNNVFYNAARWSEIKDKYGQGNQQINIVNNYYKPGPSSGNKGYEVFYYSNTGRHPEVYVKGNIGFHRTSDDQPQEMIVREDSRWMISNSRFQAPPITLVSAAEAFDLVVANAGATVPMRDAVDRRIVQDVRYGTGRVINDPSEVGGWPELVSGIAPADSDHDGMPDEWEDSRGLNKQDPVDGAAYRNDSGETHLDEYLNELAATRNERTQH